MTEDRIMLAGVQGSDRMTARVVQGYFIGGSPRVARHVAQPKRPVGTPPGPPAAAFSSRPTATAGAAAQLYGSPATLQIDPAALGLAGGGGRPLPDAVRSGMEAALGADFSAVRVHVGPQAERIGAIAFTTGTDIYFAPGRFQPDTPRGRELLGHELAHVVQQRAGRVRHPLGAGVAVVQDRNLEAEADRLGRRAAMAIHGGAVAGASTSPRRIGPSPPDLLRRSVQRSNVVQRAGDKVAFVAGAATTDGDKALLNRIAEIVADEQVRKREYKNDIESKKDIAIDKINVGPGDEESKKDARIAALKSFHQVYLLSGWDKQKIIENVRGELGSKLIITQTLGSCVFKSRDTQVVLYEIVVGGARFGPESGGVFVKLGTTKEYVKDSYDVFVSRYVVRGCSADQMNDLLSNSCIKPRNVSMKIGTQLAKYDFGIRDAEASISQAEREFLQQRDGSGPNQRLLSVTRNMNRKILSNHGETFTDEAVIVIDLSKIPKSKIFDIHTAESHARKTALKSKDSGRSKKKELGLYEYSAEKNREILLEEIPLSAVTTFKFDGGDQSEHNARLRFQRGFRAAQQLKEELAQKELRRLQLEQKLKDEQAQREREEARLAEEVRIRANEKRLASKAKVVTVAKQNETKAEELASGDLAKKVTGKEFDKLNETQAADLIAAIIQFAEEKKKDLSSYSLKDADKKAIKTIYEGYK